MANETKESPKQVPPRNDLKKVEVYAVSRATQLAGQDPNLRYQYMSTDEKNPSYWGNFTRKREIGDVEAGFAQAEPWEFVSSTEVTQGRPRDDQGKPIDTAVRHGDLVLMKTTAENYAVYEEIERRRDAAKAKRLAADESRTPGAKHVHRMGVGFEGSHTDLLNTQQGA